MPNDQTSKESGYDNPISMETLINDMGKTLSVLRNEHPDAEIIIRNDGFPEAAAIGFGEANSNYAYLFLGAQAGDAESAMNKLEEQLKCAGFMTIAGVLFPEMEEDMPFSDFFSLIGVSDYEYFGDNQDTFLARGWLYFIFNDMDVHLNTNEASGYGDWNYTGAESVKRDAPTVIKDREIFGQNYDLAHEVMFE